MIQINGKIEKELEKDLAKVYEQIAKTLSLPENILVNLSFVGEKKIKELGLSGKVDAN